MERKGQAGRWGAWRRAWPLFATGAGALFGLLAVSAWLQVQAVRLSYRANELSRELDALDRRERTARRRLDAALALHRLDDRGRTRAGLGVPRPEQVRLLADI